MCNTLARIHQVGTAAAVLVLLVGLGLPRIGGAVDSDTLDRESPPPYWILFENEPSTVGAAGPSRGPTAAFSHHLDRLRSMGIRPRVKSRLLHGVSARLSPRTRRTIEARPFVAAVHGMPAPNRTGSRASTPAASIAASPILTAPPRRPLQFGTSKESLARINALGPVRRGLDGHGVRLGFLDAHFGGLQHEAFATHRRFGRLAGLRTFTDGTQSGNHGAGVASVAAGYAPGRLIGPAHGATLLAATTEFTRYERPVEEENFVAGLEWLYRRGADVVNVSIGYNDFDDPSDSYSVSDLDGDTAVTTMAVDRAAQRGITVVVSAGNSGCADPEACWYYVNTPADADSAIVVGAVAPDSSLAPFSARGPTADGRRKPDVVVQGREVVAAWGRNRYARVSGTSFASPQVSGIVAQMLQVNPNLSPLGVRRILRQTASQARAPDNERGWGLVNAEAAVRRAEWAARMSPPDSLAISGVYRSAPKSAIVFDLRLPAGASTTDLTLFTPAGRRVVHRRTAVHPGPNWIRLSGRSVPPGLYRYVVQTSDDRRATGRVSVTPSRIL